MFRSIAASLDALSRAAGAATKVLVVVMTTIMTASLVLQVVFRYAVGQALSWSEELALLLFTWVVLLTAGLGVREGFHVSLTLLPDRLGGAGRALLDRGILVLILAFGVFLTLSGWAFVEGTLGTLSAAVGYPIELLHAAAPVSGALIVLHAAARLVAPQPDPMAGARAADPAPGDPR